MLKVSWCWKSAGHVQTQQQEAPYSFLRVFDQTPGMVTGHACYLVKLPAFDNRMHLDSSCVTLATPKTRLGAWFMM